MRNHWICRRGRHKSNVRRRSRRECGESCLGRLNANSRFHFRCLSANPVYCVYQDWVQTWIRIRIRNVNRIMRMFLLPSVCKICFSLHMHAKPSFAHRLQTVKMASSRTSTQNNGPEAHNRSVVGFKLYLIVPYILPNFFNTSYRIVR